MTASLPTVTTPQERGLMGYLETERRYGKAQMDRWRRQGGRKPSRTLGQIEAGAESSKRARSHPRREEGRRSQPVSTRFE